MTEGGNPRSLGDIEAQLMKLLRDFTDELNCQADELASLEHTLSENLDAQRKEIDKQRRMKSTEIANQATAEWLKTREAIDSTVQKFRTLKGAGVPRFVEVGEFNPITMAGLTNQTVFPVILPFFDKGGLAVVADERRGLELLASIAFRVVDVSEPRAVAVHLLNPSMLDTMSVFNALNSGGSSEFKNATTADQIKEVLDLLSRRIEENMALMQGNYANFGDYLIQRAGRERSRYHLLCIAGTSAAFKEYFPKILQIMKQGARYGVSVLLQLDQDVPKEVTAELENLESSGSLVMMEATQGALVNVTIGGKQIKAKIRPFDVGEIRNRLTALAEEGAKSKPPSIPLLGSLPDQMWQDNSGPGLRVCLGEHGDQSAEIVIGDSLQNLTNALVGGAAGSGKTVLLLTMIYGLAYRYSPDELIMYLLDYKEGVEFARFVSETSFLPHARIVGIESDQTLGNSVLKSLRDEVNRRSKLFKEEGVENLAGYKNKTRKPMPRILLVVDEFQKMLEGSDDNLMILKDLARRARSFGVHVVLSSQTLAGIQGASAEMFDQFKLRLCTKAAPDTSEAILQPGNKAAAELSGPPEAILNSDFGQIAHNRKIRVARGEPSELDRLDQQFQGRVCNSCGKALFKLGQAKCLGCMKPLPTSTSWKRPLAVQEGVFERRMDLLIPPPASQLKSAKEGVVCALGRPFNPSNDTISVEFGPAYSHLMILGRGKAEASGILQGVLLQIALRHKPGIIFVFGGFEKHGSTTVSGLDTVRTAVEQAGHFLYDASNDEELNELIGSDERQSRTFVVLPRADFFAQREAGYGELSVLGKLLEEGDQKRTHVIGWWERQNSPNKVHRDYLGLPVSRVALNVTREEVTSYGGSSPWPWRNARAFYWNSPEVTNGEWFVPYQIQDEEEVGVT
jgi:hypothetical protein